MDYSMVARLVYTLFKKHSRNAQNFQRSAYRFLFQTMTAYIPLYLKLSRLLSSLSYVVFEIFYLHGNMSMICKKNNYLVSNVTIFNSLAGTNLLRIISWMKLRWIRLLLHAHLIQTNLAKQNPTVRYVTQIRCIRCIFYVSLLSNVKPNTTN